jgi:hypothetical protein
MVISGELIFGIPPEDADEWMSLSAEQSIELKIKGKNKGQLRLQYQGNCMILPVDMVQSLNRILLRCMNKDGEIINDKS